MALAIVFSLSLAASAPAGASMRQGLGNTPETRPQTPPPEPTVVVRCPTLLSSQAAVDIDPEMVVRSPFAGDPDIAVYIPFPDDEKIVAPPAAVPPNVECPYSGGQ